MSQNKNSVKVQVKAPKLYKKKETLFQEESYLPRIFKSSSINLHTFYLINIVFWWQIFFRKHGKSTLYDRQDHPWFSRWLYDHDIAM